MQTLLLLPAGARYWLVPASLLIFAMTGCGFTPTVETQAVPPTKVDINLTRAQSIEVEHNQKFARWVAQFSSTARAAGIQDETLRIAFDNVRFVPRVIELDRTQPEFTRPIWDYLDNALSPQRIARGQDKLLQLSPVVAPIAAHYGVPPEVLVAIWGMESNYGSFVGDIPTIDALATLGYEGRREEWARSQLLAALRILQNRDIDRAQMIGSWAGAMGQTQFLPSNFLAYAVDADGDGRRDIWNSLPDVMASTANFLASSGWQAGQPWGIEVRLPAGFDYARADPDVRQPTTQWTQEGVQSMDGAPLPLLADSSILLAASARGPAFLIGPNFRTILRYNNSSSYALAVGLLAQRLNDGPVVQTPWPRDLQLLSRSQLLVLQTALNQLGFDSGAPDGVMGPATRGGVRRYQLSLGLPADGYPTLDLLQRLQ
ncbi:MAG: lytic murein transglycosylase [Gammaproteobacteria bacterium]|nr:lytic murein transglycosylase [Gammaproteobacteria bacterium]MBU3998110.1 lytic murein transglycosylase [Gammaproteobacteria bacterium]MBU4079165.1 lytic murein transglycosylase [Gammaproteobacteria bacterium]MBU4113770.1 lytic murein transglycosylase [Gammaproteobacteria bacterium]MBU4171093.1 lytic murein transglycosylase [Gammaproteobacteria bacterium]